MLTGEASSDYLRRKFSSCRCKRALAQCFLVFAATVCADVYSVFGDVGVFVALPRLFQVVSSTQIILFVKIEFDPSGPKCQPLKVVAIDTGTGAVQLNSADGGVMIGTIRSSKTRRNAHQAPKPQVRK